MANKTVHTWICDRCGLPYSAPEPPDNWETLTGKHGDTPGGDVCFPCRCEFQDWWRAGAQIRRQPVTGPDGDTPATETREPVSLQTLAAMKASVT